MYRPTSKIKRPIANYKLKNHNSCCIIVDMSLADEVKQKAIELGFGMVGITDVSAVDAEQVKLFAAWLKSGFAGQMEYMHRNLNKRFHPAELLENAKSVIVVGLNYKPPEQKLMPLPINIPTGKIASYACYEDYHPFIKTRLRQLTEFISST